VTWVPHSVMSLLHRGIILFIGRDDEVISYTEQGDPGGRRVERSFWSHRRDHECYPVEVARLVAQEKGYSLKKAIYPDI
jgi:hypothetical protein